MTENDTIDPGDIAHKLSDLGIMGSRQALAYVYREYSDLTRAETAKEMNTSRSNIDNLHQAAKNHLADARTAVRHVDEMKSRPNTAPHGERTEQEDNQ